MSDQRIECIDCGRQFTWTAGEQRFYREHGLSPPKRCEDCRQGRRAPVPVCSVFHRPAIRYGLLGFGLAVVLWLALWRGLAQGPKLSWLMAVNLITACAFGYDKLMAKLHAARVPEQVLLGLAAAGGSAGALLAMAAVHHKTAKPEFQARLMGVVLLQVVVVGAYLVLAGPGLLRRG